MILSRRRMLRLIGNTWSGARMHRCSQDLRRIIAPFKTTGANDASAQQCGCRHFFCARDIDGGGPRPEGEHSSAFARSSVRGLVQQRRRPHRHHAVGSFTGPVAPNRSCLPRADPHLSRLVATSTHIVRRTVYAVGPRQSPAPVITAGTKRRGRQCGRRRWGSHRSSHRSADREEDEELASGLVLELTGGES